MHEAEKLSLDQIEAFLNASEEIQFEGEDRKQTYAWVEQVLREQHYQKQGRKARGLVRRYLEKMTGLSRAQVTRLIARYRACGELGPSRRAQTAERSNAETTRMCHQRRRLPRLSSSTTLSELGVLDQAAGLDIAV